MADNEVRMTPAEFKAKLDDLRKGAIRAGYMLGYEDAMNGNSNFYVMQSAIAWQHKKNATTGKEN